MTHPNQVQPKRTQVSRAPAKDRPRYLARAGDTYPRRGRGWQRRFTQSRSSGPCDWSPGPG